MCSEQASCEQHSLSEQSNMPSEKSNLLDIHSSTSCYLNEFYFFRQILFSEFLYVESLIKRMKQKTNLKLCNFAHVDTVIFFLVCCHCFFLMCVCLNHNITIYYVYYSLEILFFLLFRSKFNRSRCFLIKSSPSSLST